MAISFTDGLKNLKIIQTFVSEKNILLMVASLNKWLIFSFVSLFMNPFGIKELRNSLNWGAGGLHPFHVSTTEINHNEKDKTLEISCRIFIDDFESALEKQFKTKADLSKEEMKTAMDTLVKKYILDHLKIKPDNRSAALNYVGFEKESDAAWVYLQVDNIASVKKLEIVNSILFDLFDDQMSIIHVKVNGIRKSTKLDYPEKQAVFNF